MPVQALASRATLKRRQRLSGSVCFGSLRRRCTARTAPCCLRRNCSVEGAIAAAAVHNFDPARPYSTLIAGGGGDLFVCREPLQVLLAVENGIAPENVWPSSPTYVPAIRNAGGADGREEDRAAQLF